jgi:hypothetical protein
MIVHYDCWIREVLILGRERPGVLSYPEKLILQTILAISHVNSKLT